MSNSDFSYDFSAIFGQSSPATTSLPLQPQPPLPPTLPNKKRLHFESSRAGGTFTTHNHIHWNTDDNRHFHQWKKHPLEHAAQTEKMAQEICEALLRLFGGTMPLARFTSPPRGQTPPDHPHAAQELAKAVARQLDRPYQICVERETPDTQKGRSRMQNLQDTSRNRLVSSVQDDMFTVVIDDVSTTGHTLRRMRNALQGIPTLCFVYVIWH